MNSDNTISLANANIRVDKTLHMFVREQTTAQQWEEFLSTLEVQLLRRMGSTPDSDLPRLKGKVEYIGELRNIFLGFFQK